MPRLPNADARRGARARPSALKGKRSLTPAMPGEDNVPDLSFDENDGSEFSLILFRFPRNAFEGVIIDPSTFGAAGGARRVSPSPQGRPAARRIPSQAPEQGQLSTHPQSASSARPRGPAG